MKRQPLMGNIKSLEFNDKPKRGGKRETKQERDMLRSFDCQ